MNLVKNALKVSVLSVSLIMSHAVLADEAKGLEIAQERKARDEGHLSVDDDLGWFQTRLRAGSYCNSNALAALVLVLPSF